MASHLPGGTTSWLDSSPKSGVSHCYAVETTFVGSKNHGQHSAPACDWGPQYERITTLAATGFTATGGKLVLNYGKQHYEDWGAPGDTLQVTNVVPKVSGRYLVQLDAGNGAGPVSTEAGGRGCRPVRPQADDHKGASSGAATQVCTSAHSDCAQD